MLKGCLILADSHHEMLGGMRSLLAPLFSTTVMVSDENSLLTIAGQVQPDLIVVDLSLPVSSQVNIARRLKTKFPESKFIILSIYDDHAAINECLEAGACGFVLKRAAVTDLLPAAEAVMRGETYVSSV